MSIEQYFGGRIRYIQVGDNGNKSSGIGCLACSDNVKDTDVTEIRKRYFQYSNAIKDAEGVLPPYYKHMYLPSGTILHTSTSYVPPLIDKEEGRTIDRATWVDHCYLIDPQERDAVDPAHWFLLPYLQEDPNPDWTLKESNEKKKAIERGELVRPDKWITAKSLTSLPDGGFEYLPLKDVLDMWKMDITLFVQIVEAAMDTVAARDNRKLFITYNINSNDGNTTGIPARDYQLYRINHLLFWIYSMMPFSFRRLVGYDTLGNASSGFNQIIFIHERMVRKVGNQIQVNYKDFDQLGSLTMDKLWILGTGYLFVPGSGVIHFPGNNYKDLYRNDSTIHRFLEEEAEKYLKSVSKGEMKASLEEYFSFFTLLEKRIKLFSANLINLENEIIKYKVYLIKDINELYQNAVALLDKTGEYDIEIDEENRQLFERITLAIEKRYKEENQQKLWENLLQKTLSRKQFPGQINFVGKLAELISSNPGNQYAIFKKYESQFPSAKTVIDGYQVKDWLFCALAKDNSFVNQWLESSFDGQTTYQSRYQTYVSASKYIDSLMYYQDDMRQCLDQYLYGLPIYKDIENTQYIIDSTEDNRGKTLYRNALTVFDAMLEQTDQLDVYKQILEKGSEAYHVYYKRWKGSSLPKIDVFLDNLSRAVYEGWMQNKAMTSLTADEFNGLLRLRNDAPEIAERYDDRLITLLDSGKSLQGMSLDTFADFMKVLYTPSESMDNIPDDLFNKMVEIVSDRYYSALEKISAEKKSLVGFHNTKARLKNRLNYQFEEDDKYYEYLFKALPVIIPHQAQSGKRDNLKIFDVAVSDIKNDPRIRNYRRELTSNMDLFPTFEDLCSFAKGRIDIQDLIDNGFMYPEAHIRNSAQLLQVMRTCPPQYSKQKWIKTYAGWIAEALGIPQISRDEESLEILDTLCRVIMTEGIQDTSWDSCIDGDWFTQIYSDDSRRKTLQAIEKRNQDSYYEYIKGFSGLAKFLTGLQGKPGRRFEREEAEISARLSREVERIVYYGKFAIFSNESAYPQAAMLASRSRAIVRSLLFNERSDVIRRFIDYCKSGDESAGALELIHNEFNQNRAVLEQLYEDDYNVIYNSLCGTASRPAVPEARRERTRDADPGRRSRPSRNRRH